MFCNLPIVTTVHNDRGGHNFPTTRTKPPPQNLPKSPINIGFEGFHSCTKQQSTPANDKKTGPSRLNATPVNIEKSLENSHILAEKCRNYRIEMQLFCISCPKIKKNNELIYIKWFFYRKIAKKYEKIAKKQEKTGPLTTIAANATIAKNTASHRQK